MSAPRRWHGPLPAPDWFNAPRMVRRELVGLLSGAEFKVLYILMDEAYSWHTGVAAISTRQLARESMLAQRTVITSLDAMIEMGLVERVPQGKPGEHKPDAYRLLISMDKRYAGASSDDLRSALTTDLRSSDPLISDHQIPRSIPYLYKKEREEGPHPDRKKWSEGTYTVCAVCLCRPCAC